MRRVLALGLGAAASMMTEGLAQQAEAPAWANLAECSAVFGAAAETDGYSGALAGDVETIRRGAARFRARAVEEAGQAGQANPEADVASIMVYLEPRWAHRINAVTSIRSNLDWIAYCGRLGREFGVTDSSSEISAQ